MFNKDLKAQCDEWYFCSTNFISAAREGLHFADKLKLADCTLRDGEQQAGIVYTKDDKIAIAKQLDKLGVHEIEVGTPASSEEDKEAARAIAHLDLNKARTTALARAMTSDIDLLCDLGIWGANISFPIGNLQRRYKLKIDDDTYIQRALEITEYAKKKGLHVNFSPYDTTRCDIDFLVKVLTLLHESGNIDRVRLVDTVGSATPQAITYLVKKMRAALKEIPIEIHAHNDFGLAVANTAAAVAAGVNVVSSTINGVGERSGNAPTEEVVMMLQMLYGIDLGIDASKLKETSELVARLSGITPAPNKAVIGENCFAHESGLAVAGMRGTPFTSEAYLPELVGQVSRVVLGKKSGRASVELMLVKHGFSNYTPEDVKTLLSQIKDASIAHKRCISDDEFVAMCEKQFAGR